MVRYLEKIDYYRIGKSSFLNRKLLSDKKLLWIISSKDTFDDAYRIFNTFAKDYLYGNSSFYEITKNRLSRKLAKNLKTPFSTNQVVVYSNRKAVVSLEDEKITYDALIDIYGDYFKQHTL